jgi:branched-chain amino acid transport system ATP-binding protein
MLSVNNIEVKYSNVILVLKGLSLSLGEGEIISVLGANGAGKSTLIKAISGILHTELGEVTDGAVIFDGTRIDKIPPEQVARMGIVQAMEGRRIFQHLTTEENLMVGGRVYKGGARIKEDLGMVYSYFPRLKDVRNHESGYLSGGEQQMLVIGTCMMAHPSVMLLDEPSMGLSPILARAIFQIIKRFNVDEKTSILLVEQNAKAALEIAGYAYVMETGRVVLDGKPEKLKENEDVKQFYLGLSKAGAKHTYKSVKHYKRRKRWLA